MSRGRNHQNNKMMVRLLLIWARDVSDESVRDTYAPKLYLGQKNTSPPKMGRQKSTPMFASYLPPPSLSLSPSFLKQPINVFENVPFCSVFFRRLIFMNGQRKKISDVQKCFLCVRHAPQSRQRSVRPHDARANTNPWPWTCAAILKCYFIKTGRRRKKPKTDQRYEQGANTRSENSCAFGGCTKKVTLTRLPWREARACFFFFFQSCLTCLLWRLPALNWLFSRHKFAWPRALLYDMIKLLSACFHDVCIQ